MNIKLAVIKQYQDIINFAASLLNKVPLPKNGWIYTSRQALNMSGRQLSERLKVHRSLISRFEKDELLGAITVKSMQKIAAAMGCRFVYAIVPENNVEELIINQAKIKAKKLIEEVNIQMALEGQELSEQDLKFEITRITKDLINNMPKDFWLK